MFIAQHRAKHAYVPDWVFDAIESILANSCFQIERTTNTMIISAPLDQVTMNVTNEGSVQINFDASSPAQLQMLTDLYAQRVAKLGLE